MKAAEIELVKKQVLLTVVKFKAARLRIKMVVAMMLKQQHTKARATTSVDIAHSAPFLESI